MNQYITVDADGWYGDHATVWGVHDSPEKARAAARGGSLQAIDCKGECRHGKGDRITRAGLAALLSGGNWVRI
jgi:hypothetical protein